MSGWRLYQPQTCQADREGGCLTVDWWTRDHLRMLNELYDAKMDRVPVLSILG